MKINDSKSQDVVLFSELEAGVVFKLDGIYYMKIKYIRVYTPINAIYNAVSLNSGIPLYIVDKYVTPVDGEFVVKKVNA
jgi:hypothetical protein